MFILNVDDNNTAIIQLHMETDKLMIEKLLKQSKYDFA